VKGFEACRIRSGHDHEDLIALGKAQDLPVQGVRLGQRVGECLGAGDCVAGVAFRPSCPKVGVRQRQLADQLGEFDELTYYEGLAIRLAKRRRLLNQGPALEGGKNTMLAVTVTVGIPILIIVVLVVIVLLLMRRRGR
jgi:hypothetical protein